MNPQGTGWSDFVAARSRFLAILERDAEIHRLEVAWTLPSEVTAADARGRPGPEATPTTSRSIRPTGSG